jgi:hypothetical protein
MLSFSSGMFDAVCGGHIGWRYHCTATMAVFVQVGARPSCQLGTVQVWCEASAELPVMLACILRALHFISLFSFNQLTLLSFSASTGWHCMPTST